MTLWGKSDKPSARPKYVGVNSDGTIKQDASGKKVVFLDEAESAANASKGTQGPGWYTVLVTNKGAATERTRLEKLVAIGSSKDEVAAAISNEDVTSTFVYPSNAAVFTDGARGVDDPTGRDGWYFINDATGKKVNWYFYDGAANNVQLQNFCAYAVVTIDSTSDDDAPFFGVYTARQNDGQDAASWYRSRQVYIINGAFTPGTKYLIHTGADPEVHPELPRLQLTLSPAANSNRGPRAGTERVSTSSLGSNSTSPINAIKFVAEAVGVSSPTYKVEAELRSDSSQVVESSLGLE